MEARYFSTIDYLALACEDEELEERLRRRPAWRNCANPAYIEEHISYNRWFKDTGSIGEPPIQLLDTSGNSVETTGDQLALWVREKVSAGH